MGILKALSFEDSAVPRVSVTHIFISYYYKKGTALGGTILTVVIVILCAAAILLGLTLGGPAVVHALQTAYD